MAGIWESLDELGSSVSKTAAAYLDLELAKKVARTSTPDVAYVPSGYGSDVSAAGKSDPNAMQRYVLWGVLGVLTVTLVYMVAKRRRG